MSAIEKLLENIKVTDLECWEWTLGKRTHGYGLIHINNRTFATHRVSWMFFNKKLIPRGMVICHTCDNPPCINPDHLFLGTQIDNLQDMRNKGRAKEFITEQPNHNGELNPSAKLSLEDVNEIKRTLKNFKPGLCKVLSVKYGVSHSTIKDIKQGRKWSTVII